MKQPTEMNKTNKLGIYWRSTYQKRRTNNSPLDEITRNLSKVSITSKSIQSKHSKEQHIDNILTEWKQHIKDNEVFYFLSLTNQIAKGKLSATPQLDSEFFYMLGKYASPPIYNLLKNSEFLDTFGSKIMHSHLYIFEGIAVGDNHHMFDHLVDLNEFRHLTHNDVQQYALSLLELNAYNTMESLIYTITKRGDNQLKCEFVTKIKANMSRVIEKYDSRMISIIMNGLKKIVV